MNLTKYSLKKTKLVISLPQPIDLFKFHCTVFDTLSKARKNPISANGMAKMVCENLMSER
jgi:hypothetical protein